MNFIEIKTKHKNYFNYFYDSTAQAINILIATWTFQDFQTKNLLWKNSTPSEVKSLTASSVNWLQANILGNKYQKQNAFFSGSAIDYVHFYDSPYLFPANYIKMLNGSDIDPKQFDFETSIFGVNGLKLNLKKNILIILNFKIFHSSGLIDEAVYEAMLKKNIFNVSTPVDFQGYKSLFPFWSSEPYTYSVSMLALSQYNNLNENNEQ